MYQKDEIVLSGGQFTLINVGASPRYNAQQKFFYYPEQTNEEALIFRHMTPKDPMLACFHGAVQLPLPEGAETRSSVEGRVFCFFKKGTVYKKYK